MSFNDEDGWWPGLRGVGATIPWTASFLAVVDDMIAQSRMVVVGRKGEGGVGGDRENGEVRNRSVTKNPHGIN